MTSMAGRTASPGRSRVEVSQVGGDRCPCRLSMRGATRRQPRPAPLLRRRPKPSASPSTRSRSRPGWPVRLRSRQRCTGLARSIAAPSVVHSLDAVGQEPVRGSDHRRRGHIQLGGNLRGASAQPQPRHRLKAQRCVWVAAATPEADQLPALRPAHSRYLHRTGLQVGWVFGDSQTSGVPRPFPSAPTSDRQSRSVI